MDQFEFKAHLDVVKRRASGRWTEVLLALGVDDAILNKRNQPCPGCGGRDRFQYTDKFGQGDYHCRGCGHGDGFNLLMHYHGWDFATALKEVERIVGSVSPAVRMRECGPSSERMKKLAQRIWNEAKPITSGDEVDRYLVGRGLHLTDYPKTLRFHPALGYYERNAAGTARKVRDYPAMLACIQGSDGYGVTLHRTYLLDGKKAVGPTSKKVLSSGIAGAAVRLFEATDELGVAEGIETALAIHLSTGKPVWAALSAGNLERLWVPATVRCVFIYADNDAASGYEGQASAFILARRLKKEKQTGPRQVEVFVPKAAGADWADVWLAKRLHARKAA